MFARHGYDIYSAGWNRLGDLANSGGIAKLYAFFDPYKPQWGDPKDGYVGGEPGVLPWNRYRGSASGVSRDGDFQTLVYRSNGSPCRHSKPRSTRDTAMTSPLPRTGSTSKRWRLLPAARQEPVRQDRSAQSRLGLCQLGREDTRVKLKRMQREARRTLIHVTHDQEQAMNVAARMAILEHGVIAQVGTPVEVYAQPGTAYVTRRLGAPMMTLIPAEAALLGTGPDGAAPMGVWPADWQVRPNADRAARIASVDPLGGITVLTLAAAGLTLRAMLRGQPAMQTGQPVSLTAAPKRMHHFAGDGQRKAALAWERIA